MNSDTNYNMRWYHQQSVEREYLSLIKSSIEQNDKQNEVFGIKLQGRPTINSFLSVGVQNIENLHWALYKLSVMERDAVATAKEYGDLFSEYCKPIKIRNTMNHAHKQREKSINFFREYFHCKHATEKDVLRLIDYAQKHVAFHTRPTNDLEASVSYYLAAALARYSQCYNNDEYKTILDPDVCAKTLHCYGHKATWENAEMSELDFADNLDMSEYDDLEEIKNVPPYQRLTNPSLLLYAVSKYKEDAISTIPNINILKEWCQSEKNYFPYEFMEGVVKVLGKDFLPDRYREKGCEQTNTNYNILTCATPLEKQSFVSKDKDVFALDKNERNR